MSTLFLKALACQNDSRPPIWLMRQAGRHLATYRALRQRHSFLSLCHDPDLIAQVTLLPIERYGLDAAIIFSDILVIPEAMGVGLRFEEQAGPIIERPVSNHQDVNNLPPPNISALEFVAQGIRQVLPQLKVPLVGFCGAPFTVASYLIEGKSSRDYKKTKRWMMQDPVGFHVLLQKITDWTIQYMRLQIAAGVQAIQIFDSWAHILAHYQFREFSLSFLKQLLEGVRDTAVPVILFCRGSSVFASQLAELAPAGISIDWNGHLPSIRQQIPAGIALQGNLDPDLLYAPLPVLKAAACRLLDEMAGDPGYIFNLGHGLPPDVSEAAVQTLVECVKERTPCPATLSS